MRDRVRRLTDDSRFVVVFQEDRSPRARRNILQDADYAIVVNAPLAATDVDHARRLRFVHKWGVGVDNIDVESLSRRSIPLYRTASTNARHVAELVVGLMLAVLRQIALSDRIIRAGGWDGQRHWTTSRSLGDRVVGLVGFGATGQATARLLRSFGCEILYTARTRRPTLVEEELAARYVTLEALLSSSDVVSLHLPLVAETKGMFGRSAFASMKRGAIMINVARGGLIDEAALADALTAGHLAGAGLDVGEVEPMPPGHALASLQQTVLTPHIGGKVMENLDAVVAHWFANVTAHATGHPLPEKDRVLAAAT